MLGKTTNGTLLKDYHIQTADLRGIVTLSDGKSYALPIDTSGKIIIPSELQSIFDGKSFKFFEVAQMVSDSEIRPIATVK
jgi:hypothetical protein